MVFRTCDKKRIVQMDGLRRVKMKIGVLTWFFGINYGARAHSLALKNVLEDMGHEVQFIHYDPTYSLKKEIFNSCHFEHRHRHPIKMLRGLKKMFSFRAQLEDYPKTEKINDMSEIKKSDFDLIILGSDEILNINHPMFKDAYYGVGIDKDIPLMMYAPSSGTTDSEEVLTEEIRKSLRDIKFLSARDKCTYNVLKNNSSKEVEEVLDPTFLYEFDVPSKATNERYILIYSFGYLKEYSEVIKKYAKERDLKIYVVGHISDWADKSFIEADLYEWLSLYKGAEVIVTDSYHGYIFALKNNKEYILISKNDKTNKIDGLMSYVGDERGYYNKENSLEEYFSKPVDYKEINKNIEILRDKSLSYLKTSLEKIKGEK